MELGLEAKNSGKAGIFQSGQFDKDRIAKAMMNEAEVRKSKLGVSIIIEPTSGNTGIQVSYCSITKGYRTIIVMPETMSVERQ